MGRSRHTQDNAAVFVLFCKLLMQGMAASFLTYPAVLLYLLINDRVLLSRHDEVWAFSCTAPLWALWAVLRHKPRRAPLRARSVVTRIVLLLVLSGVVTSQVPIPAGFRIVDLTPIRTGAVLVMLWLWIIVWRMIDRRVKPARGEIWSGMVRYEEGSYDEGEQDVKDRPCLVISTFPRHAYVLKITSKDKSERRDHIEMPAGWHPWSGGESWLRLSPLVKVPYYEFREYIRTCPEWLWSEIDERYSPDATLEPPAPHPSAPRHGHLPVEPTRLDHAADDRHG